MMSNAKTGAAIIAVLTALTFAVQAATPNTAAAAAGPTAHLAAILAELGEGEVMDDTVEDLEEFIETFPASPVTDEALVRLAGIRIEKNEFAEACDAYSALLQNFPASRFRSDALFGLGYCQYRGGLMKEAKTALRSVLQSEATLTHKVRAAMMIDAIRAVGDAPWVEPGKAAIAAILPLKGKYAPFGEAALKGILLATRVFNVSSNPIESRLDVEVKITDLTAAGRDAGTALRKLYDDRRVAGIVGPLRSRTAGVVARTAEEVGMPVIALTQRSEIPEEGEYIFRNFLTPRQQAESIADYAFDILGDEKFAILSPSNRYGSELARLFKQAILSLGGEIVAEISYKPGQKDFAEEFEFLFGIEVKEKVVGRRHLREYTSTLEVDAIYIPDYPDAIGQITPFLAYYNIEEVRLLGSNGWNSPRLLKLAGEHVEGAVFVDGFYSWSERPGSKEFIELFRSVYGTRPGVIEAQAYDAAMMLLEAVDAGDGDRDAVKAALENAYGFEGATGTMSFDYNGEASKELFILTVKDGRITEAF